MQTVMSGNRASAGAVSPQPSLMIVTDDTEHPAQRLTGGAKATMTRRANRARMAMTKAIEFADARAKQAGPSTALLRLAAVMQATLADAYARSRDASKQTRQQHRRYFAGQSLVFLSSWRGDAV